MTRPRQSARRQGFAADISAAASILARAGGIAKWTRYSCDGKPTAIWRAQAQRGGQARARKWRTQKLLKAYRLCESRPPAECIEAMREAVLDRWLTSTVAAIADELQIHEDTVRKYARQARRAGDPRAASKRPDLIK